MLQVINPIKNALQQGWKKLPKKRIASFVGMFIFCAMATYASSKAQEASPRQPPRFHRIRPLWPI